jgi:hypothetical protein
VRIFENQLIWFRYSITIAACVFLFFYGIISKQNPTKELLSVGLGASDPRLLIYTWALPTEGVTGLIANVMIANLPQVILSAIYYTYNSLFTCFLLSHEWNSYSTSRKGLRVSTPASGAQRTTYFLQLPYRYALPLMALSGVMHWLCSQSLFLVSLNIESTNFYSGSWYDEAPDESDPFPPHEYLTCGYSPQAILATIIISLFMVAAVLLSGRRKLRSGMPVAGTCSAAISAMCHLPGDQIGEEAAFSKVQWGVTKGADSERIGHCSFSDLPVETPIRGSMYAGI